MKKKLVLVLDVELDNKVDMQGLANVMSQAIQTVDNIVLHDLVLFDHDENSSDKLIADIKKGL